jgi:hypothetical protein
LPVLVVGAPPPGPEAHALLPLLLGESLGERLVVVAGGELVLVMALLLVPAVALRALTRLAIAAYPLGLAVRVSR